MARLSTPTARKISRRTALVTQHLTASNVDVVRAFLHANANRYQDYAIPVSVTAITLELRRRQMPIPISESLQLLMLIRDVQSLGRGFWVPVPTHRISADGFDLIVSGLPNQELIRRYGFQYFGFGASRLISSDCPRLSDVPFSAFREWLDAPPSTEIWTQSQISAMRFSEPLGLDSAEYFRHWPGVNGARWTPLANGGIRESGFVLARHRASTGQTNHYLLKIARKRIIAMSEQPHDSDFILRLQFGLRSIEGDQPVVRVAHMPETSTTKLRIPRVPMAERRFLLSVGEVTDEHSFGHATAIMHGATVGASIAILTALGCLIVWEGI